MNILDKIEELNFAYLETFTSPIQKPWGYLFCNDRQPDYYDANHAYVRSAIKDPISVIEEVVSFYEQKKITPRFYIYDIDNQTQFISELKGHGFGFEELIHPVQMWNNEIAGISDNTNVSIEIVTEENYHDALYVECNTKEIGGSIREKALREEFDHPAYNHYLLRFNGVACSTACIFVHGQQARMESVATLEEFRGQGLIGHLIRYIQGVVKSNGYQNLWVFPINERVERVYARYGFVTLDTMISGHAYLGGKSIKEIHEG